LIQGETLGVSIGNITMLFLLIFPPMLIVVLYPAVQSFGQSLTG
jgi:hypothetical protein